MTHFLIWPVLLVWLTGSLSADANIQLFAISGPKRIWHNLNIEFNMSWSFELQFESYLLNRQTLTRFFLHWLRVGSGTGIRHRLVGYRIIELTTPNSIFFYTGIESQSDTGIRHRLVGFRVKSYVTRELNMMNFEKSVGKLFTVTRGTTISSLQKEGCRGCRVILIDRFSWHHKYLVFDTTGEVWRPKMFVLTWGTRSSASTGSHCHLHSWTPWQWHGILMSRNAFERSLKKCIYGTVIRWIRRTWVSACGTYYFRLLP